MKKVKFVIVTALLFAVLELGMWGYSQWTYGDFGLLADEKVTVARLEEKIRDSGENQEEIEALVELLENNPETEDFVKDYPDREKWTGREIQLTKEEKKSDAPLFLQWDRRWGYFRYGEKMLAINGCGPTCLSMVLNGLRKDSAMNPKEVAEYSEKKGYLTENSGTDWGLMTDGAKDLGLKAEVISLDENVVLNALKNGSQIICSMGPGDFTATGHFIVIYGQKDGKLLIHDPNSRERSEKEWEFGEIEGQIKNLWKYN